MKYYNTIILLVLSLFLAPAALALSDFEIERNLSFVNGEYGIVNATHLELNGSFIYDWSSINSSSSAGGIQTVTGDSFITVENGSTTNLSFNTTSGDSRYLRDTTDSVDSGNIAPAAVGSSELASTTVSSGSYGNATHLAQLNIDQDGRITVASNVLITALWSSLSGVPAGFADGVDNDTQLTDSEVESIISSQDTYLLNTGDTANTGNYFFNNNQGDFNFTVASSGEEGMLFVDGPDNQVVIHGTSDPDYGALFVHGRDTGGGADNDIIATLGEDDQTVTVNSANTGRLSLVQIQTPTITSNNPVSPTSLDTLRIESAPDSSDANVNPSQINALFVQSGMTRLTNLTANESIEFSSLTNCDTIDTDSNGVLSCGTDADTTYTAGGTLLDLSSTTFSLNEGTLNNGELCRYVSGTGLVCDQTDSDTQLSDEQVEDIAGAMVSGNTETLISVAYQDADGTLDFVVDNSLSNYNNDAGFLTAVTSSDITDDTILEADLSTDNEPSDGYVLQYNSSSGNFYWDVDNSAASGMASFNYGNETTTTEITDGETIRVSGGTGIIAELVGNTVNLTNTVSDTNLSGSSAGGDLAGTYPNPTIASGAVQDAEIDYGEVTLNDFTDDVGYALDSRVDAVNTSSNINSLFADDLTTDDDTTYTAGETYINLDGTVFSLDEAQLNTTIDARDDDTTYTAGGEYIYLSSTQFLFNETQLNATIDARDTDTQLSQEQVEDFAGGMWTGNTEDGATVTYQDGDGTLDISVSVGSSHIIADAIKDSELDYSSVTLNDFTNDAGYVTSADDSVSGSELDGVFSTTGLLKRTGDDTYTTITDNSADWDTAFGWGDHSTQNYFDKDTDIGTAPTATGQVLTWDDTNSEYDAGNINDIEGTLSVNAGGTGNAGGFTSGELLVGNSFSPISTTTDILSRDTSPQLGGDLDGQAFDISTTGNVNATAYDLDSGGQVSDNSSCTVITSPGGTGRIEVCD